MTTKLTDTHILLERAVETNEGRITSDLIKTALPHVKGGTVSHVLTALANKGLIAYDSNEGYTVTGEGQRAISPDLPCTAVHGFGNACPECAIEPDADAEGSPADQTTESTPMRERRMRANSKQAEVIRMLQRAEGATIVQICAETNWQPHTIRGFLAGAVKKKLGLTLSSERTGGGDRIYRLT